MKRWGSPFSLPPRWRWLSAPILALSSVGTAAAMWLHEEALVTFECVGLAALPGLAAPLYWLNHRAFKSRRHQEREK